MYFAHLLLALNNSFLFLNSQPQASSWTQLSGTEFCVRYPMTAVNWAPHPGNTFNKPDGHFRCMPPRLTASEACCIKSAGEIILHIVFKYSSLRCAYSIVNCVTVNNLDAPWPLLSILSESKLHHMYKVVCIIHWKVLRNYLMLFFNYLSLHCSRDAG